MRSIVVAEGLNGASRCRSAANDGSLPGYGRWCSTRRAQRWASGTPAAWNVRVIAASPAWFAETFVSCPTADGREVTLVALLVWRPFGPVPVEFDALSQAPTAMIRANVARASSIRSHEGLGLRARAIDCSRVMGHDRCPARP